ncbi:Very-short-patch mismatch repair endonuclease (G-T specific) [Rubellimicrobium mesophilum DSM 19309]|uniref:Very-short-patch mismatch repair endonuclease (G-T specific) n=1 Tax=Rubellimicrobium mesophilum DSM 19309 TaxID=442562 RepID=A0A017HIQ1_9RHOB|nr:Very-short-patch mismatch repair endonuclease (G-T specific) [Rubellimicrobium mesophilum DSM 19309]
MHGCFWHRHPGCPKATTPATRPEWWQRKFDGNVERDRQQMDRLIAAGWRVGIVWECALGRKADGALIDRVEAFIRHGRDLRAEWP